MLSTTKAEGSPSSRPATISSTTRTDQARRSSKAGYMERWPAGTSADTYEPTSSVSTGRSRCAPSSPAVDSDLAGRRGVRARPSRRGNLALLLPVAYRHLSSGRQVVVRTFEGARAQLDTICASERVTLPLLGVLRIGY